jgi:hypothetical protein
MFGETNQQTTMQSSARTLVVSCAAALTLTVAVQADEHIFGYTNGAEVLPKGKWEAYGWFTGRFDKGVGHYTGLDLRQQIEVGLTDRLQLSFYVNERYHNFSESALEDQGKKQGSGEIDEGEDDGRKHAREHSRFAFQGNQIALKYMMLSPFKDPFGLAFYVEPGYSLVGKVTGERVLEWELRAKVIAQKNFLDDQLITSVNLAVESEWGRGRPSRGQDFDGNMTWEATGGIAYRFAPNWFLGVEARYRSGFPNMDINNQQNWTIFAGPTIHYGSERWWATLTWLPQVTGWPNDPARSNNLHFGEQERHEVRLKVGYNF